MGLYNKGYQTVEMDKDYNVIRSAPKRTSTNYDDYNILYDYSQKMADIQKPAGSILMSALGGTQVDPNNWQSIPYNILPSSDNAFTIGMPGREWQAVYSYAYYDSLGVPLTSIFLKVDGSNDPVTGTLTLQNSADLPEIIVKAKTAQTANLQEWQDSTAVPLLWVEPDGEIVLDQDSKAIKFGADQDATILYDGTNLVINPKAVGTGVLSVSGNVSVTDEVYGSSWNGSLNVPTKNAIYDRLQATATLPLFDHYTDTTVGGAEADIYTATLAAGQLANNGDKVVAEYGGNFVTIGTELVDLLAKFAGTTLWDSTGIAPTAGTSSWRIFVEIIRVSASVIRYSVSLNTTGASGFVYCTVGELTGLTLANANILKITGISSGVGSGSGDIIGKMGFVRYIPAA